MGRQCGRRRLWLFLLKVKEMSSLRLACVLTSSSQPFVIIRQTGQTSFQFSRDNDPWTPAILIRALPSVPWCIQDNLNLSARKSPVLQRRSAPDRNHMLWSVCVGKEATGQAFCGSINKSNQCFIKKKRHTDSNIGIRKKEVELLSFCHLFRLMWLSTKTEPQEISETKLFKVIVLPAGGEYRRERQLNRSACVLPVQRYS